MLDLTRRKFLVGLGLVGIAPALVQASSIMRVRPVDPMDDGIAYREVVWGGKIFVRSLQDWDVYNAGVPYSKSTTAVASDPFQRFEEGMMRPLVDRMLDSLQTPDRKWLTLDALS